MSAPDPLAKPRRFVPLLAILVVLQAVLFVVAVFAGRLPPLWPLAAGDLAFSGGLLYVLWRMLGRPRG